MEDANVILTLIIVMAVGAGISVAAHTVGDGQYTTLDSVCRAQRAHSSHPKPIIEPKTLADTVCHSVG
jgi:hypothetical protein